MFPHSGEFGGDFLNNSSEFVSYIHLGDTRSSIAKIFSQLSDIL